MRFHLPVSGVVGVNSLETPMKGTLIVLKGNKAIGITVRERLTVIETTPMGAEFSHQCRVTFIHKGKTRSLWVAHANRLNDADFNLGNGSGVNKIRVQFITK